MDFLKKCTLELRKYGARTSMGQIMVLVVSSMDKLEWIHGQRELQ